MSSTAPQSPGDARRDELLLLLAQLGQTNQQIADGAGVKLSFVLHLRYGRVKNPRMVQFETLRAYVVRAIREQAERLSETAARAEDDQQAAA